MKDIFRKDKKYYIRLDKTFRDARTGNCYPKIRFRWNELTKVFNPEIEIFDSIFRAYETYYYENLTKDNKETDITEISGEELKAFIEKLNNTYKKNFRIKYHLRNEESMWTGDFLKKLPEIYKIIKQDSFFHNGGFTLVHGLIVVLLFIAIIVLRAVAS